MLQVATFALPADQQEANDFLSTHVPEGPVHFNTNMIVVFYDDGIRSPMEEVAQLRELLKANATSKLQLEIAEQVIKSELADLNPKHNTGQYQAKNADLIGCRRAIDAAETKAVFVQDRIDHLLGVAHD